MLCQPRASFELRENAVEGVRLGVSKYSRKRGKVDRDTKRAKKANSGPYLLKLVLLGDFILSCFGSLPI